MGEQGLHTAIPLPFVLWLSTALFSWFFSCHKFFTPSHKWAVLGLAVQGFGDS